MNRKTILGVVVALGLFAGGVSAGDYIYAFRNAPTFDIAVTSPCTLNGSQTRNASGLTVYDRNAWIVFTCEDGSTILRRYLNPNDNAISPVPVYTVPNPNVPEQPTTPATPATVRCTVPGMVTSIYGGCVPPNHPSAPKR